MTIRLECYVLLGMGWKPVLPELCATIGARYPGVGTVRGRASEEGSGMPDVISIEGADISMSVVNAPYPPEQLVAPLRLTEHVDAEGPARAQVGYIMLSTEWRAPEDAALRAELAGAYAAMLTIVSATVAAEANAIAVFWSDSWRLRTTEEVRQAAFGILEGELPRDLWVSFGEVRSAPVAGTEMRGMMSFGLRSFSGREVELAPAPVSLSTARALCAEQAERLMAGEEVGDYETVAVPGQAGTGTLRLAERFMRPRQPVALLVLPDAKIDPETLEPKHSGSRGRGGLVGRLFRR